MLFSRDTRISHSLNLYLYKRKRQDKVKSASVGTRNSPGLRVSLTPNENDNLSLNVSRDEVPSLADAHYYTVHSTLSSLECVRRMDDVTEVGPTLKPSEDVQTVLERMIDVSKRQHEDMKHHFERQIMEIKRDIEQNKTRDLLDKIDETMDARCEEIRNEINVRHNEIRRRFERVESKVNRGYFN